VTQDRNRAAARLYERMGFRTTRVEHWYHLWFDGEAGS
jgi:predicted GNAT family acetyltransferase